MVQCQQRGKDYSERKRSQCQDEVSSQGYPHNLSRRHERCTRSRANSSPATHIQQPRESAEGGAKHREEELSRRRQDEPSEASLHPRERHAMGTMQWADQPQTAKERRKKATDATASAEETATRQLDSAPDETNLRRGYGSGLLFGSAQTDLPRPQPQGAVERGSRTRATCMICAYIARYTRWKQPTCVQACAYVIWGTPGEICITVYACRALIVA